MPSYSRATCLLWKLEEADWFPPPQRPLFPPVLLLLFVALFQTAGWNNIGINIDFSIFQHLLGADTNFNKTFRMVWQNLWMPQRQRPLRSSARTSANQAGRVHQAGSLWLCGCWRCSVCSSRLHSSRTLVGPPLGKVRTVSRFTGVFELRLGCVYQPNPHSAETAVLISVGTHRRADWLFKIHYFLQDTVDLRFVCLCLTFRLKLVSERNPAVSRRPSDAQKILRFPSKSVSSFLLINFKCSFRLRVIPSARFLNLPCRHSES